MTRTIPAETRIGGPFLAGATTAFLSLLPVLGERRVLADAPLVRSPEHDDLRAERDAREEVDGILIDHADAARGGARADRPRLIGAVYPIQRVLVALPQIHGARAERV